MGAIDSAAEDLIAKCLVALGDPGTEEAGLQVLVSECSQCLSDLLDESRALRRTLGAQIEEVAVLLETQEAVWPEEVARLQALSRELRNRAASLVEG